MNKEEIKKILPHRDDMLLIDEAEIVDGKACQKKDHRRGIFPSRSFSRKSRRSRRDTVRDTRAVHLRASRRHDGRQRDPVLFRAEQRKIQASRKARRYRRDRV